MGTTPFLEAAYDGNVQFMQKLLKAFPEEKLSETKNIWGETAVNLALRENHDSILEFIIQQRAVPIHVKLYNNRTLFLEAAYNQPNRLDATFTCGLPK